MYPEPRVTDFVSKNFIPVRLHVKTHPEAMGRFGADWTPTVMLLDSNGQERHRIEGFLPADRGVGSEPPERSRLTQEAEEDLTGRPLVGERRQAAKVLDSLVKTDENNLEALKAIARIRSALGERQKALDALMEGRSAIVIAHRLSTIRAVDRIVVFHKGRVVETFASRGIAPPPKGMPFSVKEF